jgi:drug/metabolite transporter (DMT)-like permease
VAGCPARLAVTEPRQVELAATSCGLRTPAKDSVRAIGAAGFEPANLRDPNAALYQTELRPGGGEYGSSHNARHMPVDRRRPRLGYLLAAAAAGMFAVNGSIAEFLLDDGVSAVHLSQLRATLSFALLAGALALFDRSRLRIARADVPRMAWLGIAGLALVQLTYFLAIERLPISVALVIQFTGPLLVLLWLRVAHGRRLSPALYGAVALSIVGSALVVEVYDAGALDGLGIAFALAAAVTFALYLVGFERAGHRYDAFTTLTWGLGFATLFWIAASPPWTFPFEDFGGARNLALALGVVVIGTLGPFLLNVSALRQLPAARIGVVATLEPPLATAIAWAIHGETLTAVQIAGGLLVVVAVAWVQANPPAPEVEAAPVDRRLEGSPASVRR